MYFVDSEGDTSAYLSSRFNESYSPIRDVIGIYICFSMLYNFINYYSFTEKRRLTFSGVSEVEEASRS